MVSFSEHALACESVPTFRQDGRFVQAIQLERDANAPGIYPGLLLKHGSLRYVPHYALFERMR